MAFQRERLSTFYQFLQKERKNVHDEQHFIAENFILEERLLEQREDSYAAYLHAPTDFVQWLGNHRDYLDEQINISDKTSGEIPETFTDANSRNLFSRIDEDQYLVRVEDIHWPAGLIGEDGNRMFDYLHYFIAKKEYTNTIEDFLEKWNQERDLRPIFAGFWGEVKDIFTDSAENEIDNPDWANQLRDRFGLGHYNPEISIPAGEPIPVLLLRYRVKDVLAAAEDTKVTAVPTVLDSDWNPFFCPTPADLNEGQTVDLSPGGEDEYTLNCEILHRFLPYTPSYLYRVGWIERSPGKECAEARRIHLTYLRDDLKNFDEITG
ncbi:hypothetical protein GKODMF_12215 [Candidatus Electrothrix gigas]